MALYHLNHLKGPYEKLVRSEDIEAESDVEAIKIAHEKRQLFAMELKKGGQTIRRWESLLPDRYSKS